MTLPWLTAFLWTIALELPIYTLFLRGHVQRWWTPCLVTFAVNTATHPAFWFVFPRFEPHWHHVLTGEICVAIVEAALVAIVTRRLGVAALASVAANAGSTLIGLWVAPLALRS